MTNERGGLAEIQQVFRLTISDHRDRQRLGCLSIVDGNCGGGRWRATCEMARRPRCAASSAARALCLQDPTANKISDNDDALQTAQLSSLQRSSSPLLGRRRCLPHVHQMIPNFRPLHQLRNLMYPSPHQSPLQAWAVIPFVVSTLVRRRIVFQLRKVCA